MSLLMDIQTNRCWARVDFLATGEIVLHIPEECELPIRVLVSRGGRSTEYEPSNSEIPNSSTISKMEQVEDEPKTQTETQKSNLSFEKADEPQTVVRLKHFKCPKCGRSDYIRSFEDWGIDGGIYKYKCINCNTYIKDEPQTERSE